MRKKDLKIENIGVIVTFKGYDKIHQALINDKIRAAILNIIEKEKGVIEIAQTPIKGIKIDRG